MPFTLAHPAAIIPIKKHRYGRQLVLSALIIGSVVPDIGYFIPLPNFNKFTQSFWGILSFDLLVGLLLLWGFHRILKRPLTLLLPHSHRQHLLNYCDPFPFFPWPRFALIVISLLLGSLTHIGWDAMTHGHGWLVQNVSFFQTEVTTFDGITTRVFFVFKHFSTLIGLTLLVYWYWQWFRDQQRMAGMLPDTSATMRGYIILYMAFVILACVGGMLLTTLSIRIGYGAFSQYIRWMMVALGVSIFGYILTLRFIRLHKPLRILGEVSSDSKIGLESDDISDNSS